MGSWIPKSIRHETAQLLESESYVVRTFRTWTHTVRPDARLLSIGVANPEILKIFAVKPEISSPGNSWEETIETKYLKTLLKGLEDSTQARRRLL